MKFTKNQTQDLVLALYYAIEWENSILDAHSTCSEDDESYIEVKDKCNKNIKKFSKLRNKIIIEGIK